jgi:hypothetical protein
MMKRIHEGTKREKSWVKFGISPFGIPRPQLPGIEYVKGFDHTTSSTLTPCSSSRKAGAIISRRSFTGAKAR